ncbi:MAG: DUF72 domain-containing protein [Anaerolineales bacterium]
MIRFGTSGFSYDDWIGPVYPGDLPRREWLAYYAKEFDSVELNVTFYRVPGQKTVSGWVERTPPEFTFSVKANRELTHERGASDWAGFRSGIGPLIDSGKLACVLAQFPYSFHPTAENRAYLERLREGLEELPVVVEFRDQAWVTDETFAQLSELSLGYCSVDEPNLHGLMPAVAKVTGPLAYVRFHGRNAEKWWEHEQAWERYDYSYSADELREWVPKIRSLETESEAVLVYANNHYRGQSLDTIRKLRELLGVAR